MNRTHRHVAVTMFVLVAACSLPANWFPPPAPTTDCTTSVHAGPASLEVSLAAQAVADATDGSGNVDLVKLRTLGFGAPGDDGCLLTKGFARRSTATFGSGAWSGEAGARAAMFALYPGAYFHTERGDL